MSNLDESRKFYGSILRKLIDEFHILIERYVELVQGPLISTLLKLNIAEITDPELIPLVKKFLPTLVNLAATPDFFPLMKAYKNKNNADSRAALIKELSSKKVILNELIQSVLAQILV